MSETRRKIAVIVLAAFGIFCLIGVIDDMSKWTVFCPSSVTVEAVVTGNKETYYTKGSYHYRYTPYVSYTVNDKQYDNVLVETGEPDPVTPYPVGSSMTLDVDGKHPGKILRNPNTSTFIFIILTLASGVMAWVMHLGGNSEKYDRIMKRKMI
ncbi:MAG: hypothetical protein ILP19_08475 [Oscillospiraceae bacterium]|nr:hypothetical protein [Oscillospiraceae bacterium]